MLDTSPVGERSPWHGGELEIQTHAGVSEQMASVGRRNIRDHLTEQHRSFYPLLPFIVAGTVDPVGDPWATLIPGVPGFLASPDRETLTVSATLDPSDPAAGGIAHGRSIGLLGIELHTRRRNRLNGVVTHQAGYGFTVGVRESFGNCPQYIRLRQYAFERDPEAAATSRIEELQVPDAATREMMAKAETLFIASYADSGERGRQVDVSHRGGRPGFVRVDATGSLTIPDFSGNRFFNTLGNIRTNPRAGLAFIDFASGDVLQLTGEAEVVLDGPNIAAFRGAERLLVFHPRRIVRRRDALPLRWVTQQGGMSPNSLLTGDWSEAARRVAARETSARWRPMRITEIVDESSTVRSLRVQPADGGARIPHRAGQHLPIRVATPDDAPAGRRAYTISAAPPDNSYRISVRSLGAVSRRLHALAVGDTIEALAPAGDFTIDAAQRRPAVLVAAGIGITPMLAMLRHLLFEGARTGWIRPTVLFYAARSRGERAFDGELMDIVRAGQGAIRLVRILSDPAGAELERDYEIEGWLDLAVLESRLGFDDYDVFLCGPGGFMQDLHDALRGLNVPEERIHAEAFGPSALARSRDLDAEPQADAAKRPVNVRFDPSGVEATWSPGEGSLLDLAERAGLSPPYGCRAGSCGTCRSRVAEGAVVHTTAQASHGTGEVLLCSAVPAAEGGASLAITIDPSD